MRSLPLCSVLLLAAAVTGGCARQSDANAAMAVPSPAIDTVTVAEHRGYSVPVRMTRYGDEHLCSYGQSVADPAGLADAGWTPPTVAVRIGGIPDLDACGGGGQITDGSLTFI